MTNGDFQGRVLRELSGVQKALGTLNASVVRVEERQSANERRLEALEIWRADEEAEAEQTGRHELAKLHSQIEAMTTQEQEAARARRRRWLELFGKAGLLVIGSILAILAPYIAKFIGVG